MSDLSPALRLRRARLLRFLAKEKAPSTVPFLSERLGWSLPTVRTHLQGLLDGGFVVRINYRRWAIDPELDMRKFHANSL